ncbi:MAG: hypothetical protein V1769_05620 [Thermoplasmatota archaeon]
MKESRIIKDHDSETYAKYGRKASRRKGMVDGNLCWQFSQG